MLKNGKHSFYNLIIVISMFYLGACGKSYYYNADVDIPEGMWSYDKAVVFEPNIVDTTKTFNLIFSVSNNDDYGYSNVWLFVSTVSPEGFVHKDTLEYLMAENDGKWTGEKSGDFWERKLYFKNQVRFPKQGKYTFSIEQGMRDTILEGIVNVGLQFEELETNN